MKKKKVIDIKKLKKKAWDLCSKYVRQRDLGRCITCGDIRDWKEQNAGHFMHGSTTPIYLDERNVNCQCVKCNKWLGGNLDVYAMVLIRKYGRGIIEKLVQQKYIIKKFKVGELQEIIDKYTQKIKKLCQE